MAQTGRVSSNRISSNRTNAGRTNTTRVNSNRANTYRNNTSRNNTNRNSGNAYIYDNTARQLSPARQWEDEPRRQLSHETRKNRDKARHMSFGYVAFLTVAFCTCAFVLINYIQLQAELTNRTKGLARLESELNRKRLENDEEYNRITSSIDLEEIKRVAIGELGMTYAGEGQIITYSSVENDYMRQVGGNSK